MAFAEGSKEFAAVECPPNEWQHAVFCLFDHCRYVVLLLFALPLIPQLWQQAVRVEEPAAQRAASHVSAPRGARGAGVACCLPVLGLPSVWS